MLETGWWMAAFDANYDSQLDQMIVATSNKFTVLKKLADDIAVLLQPACPGSSFPATLIDRPPWSEPLSSTGGPATARRRDEECPPRGRARREAPRPARVRDLHIHVYEQIVYIGIYKASEDATTLAFFSQLEALDAFVEKHLDLATKAAAP